MPRTRSLKPTFFTDVDIAELPPLHRLAFQGLWCQADRRGILEDKPRQLKVSILPFDECDFEKILTDLAQPKANGLRPGFIVRYQVGGRRLMWIPSFVGHQHPHRDEKPTELPEPPPWKPLESQGHGVSTESAPLRHGGDVECHATSAPSQHHASTPVTVTVTGTVSGNRAAPADARRGVLFDRLIESFRQVNGTDYRGNAFDTNSLTTLMGHGPDEEIDRRWRASLVARFPKCAYLNELVKHWDHFAAKSGAAPPIGAARRRIGAEETKWDGQTGGISNDL